jgi:hypothetical protein
MVRERGEKLRETSSYLLQSLEEGFKMELVPRPHKDQERTEPN